MSYSFLKANLLKAGIASSVLLLASAAAFAQSAVTLTAAPQNATLPDGQVVPMWGYTCSAPSGTGVSCTAMNGTAQTGGTAWQPPLITVPGGQPLTINLVNNLSFPAVSPTNFVPTSLVIVGQLGGGLGDATKRTTMPSPSHAAQGTTWPGTLGDADSSTCTSGDPLAPGAAGTFCPPLQADRVRSFGIEVVAAGATAVAPQVPSGSALTWTNLSPGTYLIESGTEPSIQGPMGLYGVLVVTDPLSTPTVAQAYGTTFDKDVALLFSEIDPVQNAEVAQVVQNAGFLDTTVWSGLPGACGDVAAPATAHTCYPPAVNYSPRYYLINGASFDSTNTTASALAVPTAGTQTRVMLRLVNAGLHMHVPAVVGANMSLIAEDGNKLPGLPKIQSEVFLAAGKTYDITIQPKQTTAGTYDNATYPIFDRGLGLSTNNQLNGGMQAHIQVGTGALPGNTALVAGVKAYYCVAGTTLAITDPANGVLGGAVGANGAAVSAVALAGVPTTAPYTNFSFQSNGTFTYTQLPTDTSCGGTFTYLVNGTASRVATITQCDASTPACAGLGGAPTATADVFTSKIASRVQIGAPGVLINDSDPTGLTLTAAASGALPAGITLNADGSFTAVRTCPALPAACAAATVTFQYNAMNSQKRLSSPATVTVNFPAASNLVVNVKDAKNGVAINDYRWIIEEDKTVWIDPKCQINSTLARTDSNGRDCPSLPVESLGYNFHTANMPVVAAGCVGKISCEYGQTINNGTATACDVGNGACLTDGSKTQKDEVRPSAVALDPTKRYFISILPGDGVNTTIGGSTGPVDGANGTRPFDIALDCGAYNPSDPRWQPGNLGDANGVTAMCGHGMGGSQIAPANGAGTRPPVNISLQQTPLPTAKIAVFVFEDDNPLNGENDAGGGVDVIAPNEPGLGGFEIKIFDQAGGLGDATGQITYDEFNMPVSNSLAGTIDPITGFNACPITARTDGMVGMIPTCPKYEDGNDPLTGLPVESPLAGQAVIANLYAGLYEIVATPGADRIARGEEWLQTNTLDGAKAHEAFIKPNEPGYFQEFGPGGFHVSIGFANPKIIKDRKTADFCASLGGCNADLNVQVTSARMSRTPDQRIYSSKNYDAYAFSQCYVAIGPADGPDFAFEKCGPDGIAHFTGLPQGDFKLTVFDQWNELMLDGLVSPVTIDGSTVTKEFPVTQWRTNLSTRTFIDTNLDGVSQDDEPGLALVNTNVRYRDGSIGFFNNTDLAGNAGFNEVFPFMNWLVVETSSTRFKQTGTHVVYDAGGAADGTTGGGTSGIADHVANTLERISLPTNQRVPGAVYCANADCPGKSIADGPSSSDTSTCATDANGITTCTGLSSGRIDPPQPWGNAEAWQGLLGQTSYIEFGMKPFAEGENGGISGHVIYASTRPFDDPALSLQLSWEPGVPRVRINLYKETIDTSGNVHLTLVDHTTTSSWDDWSQGFRSDGVPNMNCPGQDPTSPFFQTLKDSKQWLDPASPKTALTNHSLFKCYDGWSQLNQIQPAPYDGMYKFPSVTGIDPATGKPTTTNCTACTTNPDATDPFRSGAPMLPAGKYVVEVILPDGYELVKEEDKNILLGDVYVAPVAQQFGGPGNIFIMPDQAAVNGYYNANNPGNINLTTNIGASPRHEGDTGSVETFWKCVGAERIVPDLNSLYPGAGQAAPFAGAKRNLCDRKEVVLEDQMTVLAKFFIFSSTHVAGHFTGTITNDFASEFDPFSPQFGEKFGPPNLPVAMRDFTGNEVARVYSDQWGIYNGLYFSTYSVNPPNPTGYIPQMSIACMNDPGPIAATNNLGQYVTKNPTTGVVTVVASADLADKIIDPAYSPAYSNYCYETPFMPGFTAYMDTPVIPTMAFADGYNLPDSEYPDATPAIGSVVNTLAEGTLPAGTGPWVNNVNGRTLTIKCLGWENATDPCSKVVQNPNYSGPNAAIEPYNQKTITRHYGFGDTAGTVTIGGVPATCGTWSNTQLVCTVPVIPAALDTTTGVGSTCYNGASTTIPSGQTPPQRGVTGTALTNYRCGQLVITAANGKRSVDSITVTVAGKTPTVVSPTTTVVPGPFGRIGPSPIQSAIDNATPGDLIIVAPGTYKENLIMWKPVRLQGVGAASVTINADAHPAGKMDSWRRQVACLFGLTVNGAPNPDNGNFDPSGVYTCPNSMHMRADRIPFEAFVGWDAAGNGNLAQVLQEPTLMGAYEGAGVTVLGRGIRIPNNSGDLWGQGTPGVPGAFPDGSRYLTNRNIAAGDPTVRGNDCAASTAATDGRDYGTGNFQCNPSRIDGVSIINSSQGGGGVFEHGWNHFLEIANTRIYGNHGTLSGAINLGNGETPPQFTNDGTICNAGVTPAPLCPPFGNNGVNSSLIGPLPVTTNAAIPFQLNVKNHVHHNMIVNNASIGDALFSGTPSGSGGITISAGSDNYLIDHNWIAGNLSSGDGAGMAHTGVTFNGKIANNWILFNQSVNPTLPTNGGGLAVVGANSDRTLPNGDECGTTTDTDCPPGIGDGVGQGLVIDGNLIMGNSAESGSGGGLRLQQLNGSEVGTFPLLNGEWYGVTVTNNIIADNVAGWDGGGVSMQDALKVSFVNNTVVANDTTASAGVLFKTLGAINSSAPPPGCVPTPNPVDPQNPLCLLADAPHGPQPAGFVTQAHTPNLVDSLATLMICPPGFNYGNANDTLASRTNGLCRTVSMPALTNDMFFQNRAFRVDITTRGTGLQSQQNLIALTPALTQTSTGQCPSGANYWDVGVRQDDLPALAPFTGTLVANNSIFTSTNGVSGSNNVVPGASPVIAQFCNGARVPPEHCGAANVDQATCRGFNAPPGRSETTGLSPLFVFNSITPAATVDEGHNWLNLTYGPLTLSRVSAAVGTSTPPELMVATGTNALNGGAYSISGTSPAVNRGTNTGAPATDFFGNPRPRNTGNPADIGAVEYQVAGGPANLVVVNPAPLDFGSIVVGSGATTRDLVVTNNGTATFTFPVITVTAPFSRVATGSFTGLPANCAATLTAGVSCTIRIQWTAPASPGPATGTATIAGVVNSPVTITATAVAATFTATVTPNPLAFGNWATGTTSAPKSFTVTNTGNSQLSALAFGFGTATANFARSTAGAFPADAPNCGALLGVGASCTVKVTFAPTAATSYSRNLTVSATGATVTTSPVVLTGTGVAARAGVTITPNPMTITLVSPDISVSGSLTSTGAVTLTNTAAPGGSQVSITNVAVTQPGGTLAQYLFSAGSLAGPNTCTGNAIAPGQSCTVTVRFTNLLAARGPNRLGTITFTDTSTTATQSAGLIGIATP